MLKSISDFCEENRIAGSTARKYALNLELGYILGGARVLNTRECQILKKEIEAAIDSRNRKGEK